MPPNCSSTSHCKRQTNCTEGARAGGGEPEGPESQRWLQLGAAQGTLVARQDRGTSAPCCPCGPFWGPRDAPQLILGFKEQGLEGPDVHPSREQHSQALPQPCKWKPVTWSQEMLFLTQPRFVIAPVALLQRTPVQLQDLMCPQTEQKGPCNFIFPRAALDQ